MMLKRCAYPCSCADLVPRFGRSVALLGTVAKQMTDLIYNQFSHLLQDLKADFQSRISGARDFLRLIVDLGMRTYNRKACESDRAIAKKS